MAVVGIEAINVFGGSACINVEALAQHRQLDTARFNNLLMKEKAVALINEDPVSFAVNAAKPILDQLSPNDKDKIELLITCSESGIDFGKSMSTYIHHYLGLKRNCRLFEIKQACYSGTAGFQMAVNFILSQTSPNAKALVIATDISRFMVVEGSEAVNMEWSFAEPSSGAGAVALLVSNHPVVYQVDVGANGYYGYEVMDTCRPVPDSEAGDSDLSLASYLDCCEKAYLEYQQRVQGVNYASTFHYLAFHTPFGGMVKGAHRVMMRKFCQASPEVVAADLEQRVMPGMMYCQRVGNIMGATIFLSLASTIANGEYDHAKRIGLFSYGSGCCSEFYSGVVTSSGSQHVKDRNINRALDNRHQLSVQEYDVILQNSQQVQFGTRNIVLGNMPTHKVDSHQSQLYLKEIRDFHRIYEWV